MGFSRVRYNNFRNIEPREIRWSPGLNLLVGANGSGKTNVLEGVNIIAGWGPLERGTRTASLPTWDSGSKVVQLTGELDGGEGDIIRVKISDRTMLKLNNKSITATDLRWRIPVMSFLPEDMSIVEGSASYRRRLMDMTLALIVPSYALRLHEYKRGIKQKTALLRNRCSARIVDRALLPLAAWIWRMREEVVSLFSDCLKSTEELTPDDITLNLRRGGGGFCSVPEEDYAEGIMRAARDEERLRVPLVGPHRDDMVIRSDERTASKSLSRGFRRRAAISVMLAASAGVKRKLGREPVMLMDEVTAELDSEGRRILFETLRNRRSQIIAATAEPFSDGFCGSVYRVEDGRVRQIDG
jgi:DNA replication and repair protein RecF